MAAFFKDTRRFKRLSIAIPITFSVESSLVKLRDRERVEGSIENISAGGALIITSVFIPKGSTLSIDISIKHLIPELPDPLQVESKVIHTQAKVISLRVGEGGTFKMGIEFLNLTPEQRQIINAFIEREVKKT